MVFETTLDVDVLLNGLLFSILTVNTIMFVIYCQLLRKVETLHVVQ